MLTYNTEYRAEEMKSLYLFIVIVGDLHIEKEDGVNLAPGVLLELQPWPRTGTSPPPRLPGLQNSSIRSPIASYIAVTSPICNLLQPPVIVTRDKYDSTCYDNRVPYFGFNLKRAS